MKRVLVVDDSKNIRILLTKCLELEGYFVKSASNGLEAMKLLDDDSFDLAFLDIKMPQFSGTELLRRMRSAGISIPVVIITAYATIKNAIECTKLGAVTYLQKPFTAERVRNILKEIQTELLDDDFLKTAQTMINENKFSEAIHILKKALAEKPLDARIFLLLAEANRNLGITGEAEKYVKIYKGMMG